MWGGARAAPLDAATCGLLRGEQAQLEQSGVRESMAKGPEWAKARLPADKLEQIRRLIHLDEQILFRCSGRNLVDLPPEADADPAATATDDKNGPGKDAGKGKDASKDKAPAKKAAGAADKEATKPAAKAAPKKEAPKKETSKKEAEGAPAKKAAAPKPKPKVDDAYRPPQPANPQADPFAKQLQK